MSNRLFDITDRVIVVTGGLGKLGQQFAKEIVVSGGRVAILDKGVEDAVLGQDLLDALDRDKVKLINTDVTEKSSLEEALSTILECWTKAPEGVVNCAAIDSPPDAPAGHTGAFENFPEELWDVTMEVNVKGVLLTSQVFGKAMADSGGGSIINIGSTYGIVSPDHRIYENVGAARGAEFFKPVSYSASKSALINLTKYIGVYWAKEKVRCNILIFGGVFNNQDPAFIKKYCDKVPMGRMAKEDEYNGSVIYLLSDASSYLTGSALVIDGGWTSW